jgi:hypothetical protein
MAWKKIFFAIFVFSVANLSGNDFQIITYEELIFWVHPLGGEGLSEKKNTVIFVFSVAKLNGNFF